MHHQRSCGSCARAFATLLSHGGIPPRRVIAVRTGGRPLKNTLVTEIRSGGKYAFMKCRWGADYADPQTWAEPFQADSGYCFWDRSENQSIKMHYEAWASKAAKASGIYESEGERGWFFAEAEALLIEHAIAVPFSTENRSYVMSRLCDFEGEYAPYGVVNQRYKGYVLHDSSMSMEEYDAAYEQWRKAKGLRLTEAVPAGR